MFHQRVEFTVSLYLQDCDCECQFTQQQKLVGFSSHKTDMLTTLGTANLLDIEPTSGIGIAVRTTHFFYQTPNIFLSMYCVILNLVWDSH